MELKGYGVVVGEGSLDQFDVVDVKERVNEVVMYVEEKNMVGEKYRDEDSESKGFYDGVIVEDFGVGGKKVLVNIGGGGWVLKKDNEYMCGKWGMVGEGSGMREDFGCFLKEVY